MDDAAGEVALAVAAAVETGAGMLYTLRPIDLLRSIICLILGSCLSKALKRK